MFQTHLTMKKNLDYLWYWMHLCAIVLILNNLLSGLRIATLSKPELIPWSGLMPQGNVHQWHIWGGCALLSLTLFYILYRCTSAFLVSRQYPSLHKAKPRLRPRWFHFFVQHLGHSALLASLITGVWIYFFSAVSSIAILVHYYAALTLLTYIVLHTSSYFFLHGPTLVKRIVFFCFATNKKYTACALGLCVVFGITALFFSIFHNDTLEARYIQDTSSIEIDGLENEPAWALASTTTIRSYGAANFYNGETDIAVKVLYNEHDIFFLIRWRDPSKSLAHLPLIKTDNGWQVMQQGFQKFNEQKHYEDKFAVMIAENCKAGAAATAHLGHKPLKDKPPHWSGLGYHYHKTGLVDLWQWKAVRTNRMYLADDNYFGKPDIIRAGSRRYTAGYGVDAKESGTYKMNWQWFYKDGITPKRMPLNDADLTAYQNEFYNETDEPDNTWLLNWFDTKAYSKHDDHYPTGTIMPSILYYSNRFEGDRADVRAFGTWKDEYWSLELFRKRSTGSNKDVELKDGVCLWFAAFDHAQIAHSRHSRPIKLRLRQ